MSTLSLNNNIPSLRVQRNLNLATDKLKTSFERLSSGMRINRASDDAAGLAVANSLGTDRRVYLQGIRNFNDGISLLNIAESAVSEMMNILTRISEIAAQSANGTMSDAQRSSLQSEASAIQSEYNRILNSTKFNSMNPLTGENTRFSFQGGYGALGSITAQIGNALESDAFGLFSAGETTRVSTTSSGGEANSGASIKSITPDGRYVVFVSSATNIVAGAGGASQHLFVKDTETGEVKLASSSDAGVAANSMFILGGTISSDGKYVAFSSSATNLVTGTSGAGQQSFLKNMETGEITLISSTSGGVEGNGSNSAPLVTADGKHVIFTSSSTNLYTGLTGTQLLKREIATGEITLVSSNSDGVQGTSSAQDASISADGRFVAFASSSTNLISGVTGVQVYVKDTQTGEIKLASSDVNGNSGGAEFSQTSISADGRYVLFNSSSTTLVPGASGFQSYVKDLLTGEIQLVNSNAEGISGNGDSLSSSISADGRYVSFSSDSSNLVSGISGLRAYRKDLLTGELEVLSRSSSGDLASSVTGNLTLLSADGLKVYFSSSASNLTIGDTNGFEDIFLRDLSKTGVDELAGVVVSNQASASVTLGIMRDRIETLSLVQSGIGASISRIDYAISNLNSTAEALATATAQIMDTDIAEESSRLVSNQILQQAGVAMLAQANAQTKLILNLLKFDQP